VARRELHPLRGQQADERLMGPRQMAMNRLHHLLIGMRASHRQHLRARIPHQGGAGAETAGHYDPPVLAQGLTDRLQRLLDSRFDEAAGIDNDEVGAVVSGRDRVSLRTQLGEDALGVDCRLGTAEAHEAHPRHLGSTGHA
jgi:hypothetical protein